ncbi:MAG: CHC2 zinc finger domain-containing protein [Candidatus Staskawiczbacteria bacterium]|nr:CHC2 zinc finger domain-containing protein [Candidatus Staskawiczbacteria bacterium]
MKQNFLTIKEIKRELAMTQEELREKSVAENLEAEYLRELEAEHENLYPKLTDKEWVTIFPEAKENYIVPKIAELKEIKGQIEKDIIKNLEKIKNTHDRWFWEDVITFFQGNDLLKVEKQLSNLENLSYMTEKQFEKQTIKKGVSKEEIARAKSKLMERIAGQSIILKKSGANFMGLCPFHEERTPSFCVFPKTNSFHCFGCQKGGSPINFVMDFYHFTFIEAVRYLNNNY